MRRHSHVCPALILLTNYLKAFECLTHASMKPFGSLHFQNQNPRDLKSKSYKENRQRAEMATLPCIVQPLQLSATAIRTGTSRSSAQFERTRQATPSSTSSRVGSVPSTGSVGLLSPMHFARQSIKRSIDTLTTLGTRFNISRQTILLSPQPCFRSFHLSCSCPWRPVRSFRSCRC